MVRCKNCKSHISKRYSGPRFVKIMHKKGYPINVYLCPYCYSTLKKENKILED